MTNVRITTLLSAVMLAVLARPLPAAEITPFQTFNQSPLVQIYGLPSPGHSRILKKGEFEARVALDLANNFAHGATDQESVLLDGESLRSTLSIQRGFAGFEAGLELPIVSQSGGFLDGFIEGWHGFFGLPNSNRSQDPKNRLLYFYEKNGITRLRFTESQTGVGDLRLVAATQLYSTEEAAVALHGLLKVPTGNSSDLTGSGSTDCAIWFSGTRDYNLNGWGKGAIFGSIGGLAKTDGDVLRGQERSFVGFGTLGAGWNPLEMLALKLQLSSHSPFYRGSDLVELDAVSTLLVVGGTIAFTDQTALDIGVSEDVAVYRSPDISIHLGLTTRF
jgi:hypothetical protein